MERLTAASADRLPLPEGDPDGWATGVAHLLEVALAEIDEDRQAAKENIAKARSLLRLLDRGSAAPPQGSAFSKLTAWQVRRLVRFIEAHLDQPIRLDALGKVAGLSSSHFARSFKRTFGETPHAYLVRRRVERACHLMLASDLRLAEIARASGFADQAHFCRRFRQRTGQSPMVWRRTRT